MVWMKGVRRLSYLMQYFLSKKNACSCPERKPALSAAFLPKNWLSPPGLITRRTFGIAFHNDATSLSMKVFEETRSRLYAVRYKAYEYCIRLWY